MEAELAPAKSRRPGRWLIAALLLVLVGGVAWWYWPRRDRSDDFVFENPPASDIVRPPASRDREPKETRDGGWQLWYFGRSDRPEVLRILNSLTLDEQIVLWDAKSTGCSFSSAVASLKARRRGEPVAVNIQQVEQALLTFDGLDSNHPDD